MRNHGTPPDVAGELEMQLHSAIDFHHDMGHCM
jgi:hypothetical protein